jgi:ATP-dependent Clp protease ATP-binding subunit ClpB
MDFLIKGADYLKRNENFKLVGRDHELKRLTSVLMRNHANSVILVGPGGVGCSALCIGIQAMKEEPGAPLDINNKRLFWLDVDGLFSGGDITKTTDAFHRIIRRLDQITGSILLVEDTRDLIEACRNNGTMHFLNALLVAVRGKKTQIIFETKDDDLDAVLKCHSDMRELFTIVPVDEPTGDALIAIVTRASENISKHHGIKVEPEAIVAAVEFTNRYHTRDSGLSRAQPERSITLLDRALASYRLAAHSQVPPHYTPDGWATTQDELKKLNRGRRDGENLITEIEDEIHAIEQRQREVTESAPENARTQLFDGGGFQAPEVTKLKLQAKTVQAEVDATCKRLKEIEDEINAGLSLSRKMVLTTFSDISGIALDKLDQDELAKLRELDGSLKLRIFGQDPVIQRVSDGVRVARVGRRNKDRPLPFLFLGPSGVGKTEISKVLAAILYGDENALSRFDMSEYMEKHAVAKMIGAPPGYEGFEAGGILTNLMRKNSNRVLLFDEIEKAHPDVFNVFLQVLSDGRLTDNVGRTCSFADAICIFTTNIGQPHFLNHALSWDGARAAALEDLGNTYKSEFLNRFNGRQNIYCFQELDLPSMEKIVKREIISIDSVYGEKGIHVDAPPDVIAAFCADQYDPMVGARGLPGFITANLEPFIVDQILKDQDARGTAHVTYSNDNKRFDIRMAA